MIFFQLEGLGVRDLCRSGDDVTVRDGPTLHLHGPVRLCRWRGGARADRGQVLRREDLARLRELPYGRDDDAVRDHAEGILLLPDGDGSHLLVVYDSPAAARKPSKARCSPTSYACP